MRLIGHLENEAQARRFSDFLYTRGIAGHTDLAADGRWQIWVVEDTQVEAAMPLLAQFRESPDDPVFEQAAHTAERQRHREEEEQTPKRARMVDARTFFYSPPVPIGILSVVLIVISVVVAILTNLGKEERFTEPLSISQYRVEGGPIWSRTPPEVRGGQVWRLFTPMFLHFSILHLLFNMLWLRDLGSMIEARKGSWMLLLLVLVLAGTSNVGQYLLSGPMFGGMSGVVYGLLGYIWMQSKFNPASGLSLQPQTVTMMILWFVLCLTGMVGHIANTVHAVGLAGGIAWGFLEAQFALMKQRR
jgi:GlpG protein